MLIMVTGLPGAAKTLYTLSKLVPQYRGRKIFTHGIPAIDHEYFGTQDLDDPEKWYEVPEASVVIIDEAQKVFPVRPAGSQVPRKCSEFETHRHKGLDIILLTQDGSLMDVHVRKLCGKHIHVLRLFGSETSNVYEYAEFQRAPAEKAARKQAISTRSFKFPKEIFDHYKSADAHTVKRKLPLKLFVFPIALVVLVALIYYAVIAVKKLSITEEDLNEQIYGVPSANSDQQMQSNPLAYQLSFLPVIDGLPWTAPAYNRVMQVRSAPKPHCIRYETHPQSNLFRCTCYTQQVTKMLDVPQEVCNEIARNGWFDYTQADARGEERGERTRSRATTRGNTEPKNTGINQ